MNAEPKNKKEVKPRIRTMLTDIQKYLKETKISRAQLFSQRSTKEKDLFGDTQRKKTKVLWYAIAAFLLVGLLAGSIFWIKNMLQTPLPDRPSPPKSLIPATKEKIIELESLEQEEFLRQWQDLFSQSILPREFTTVMIFDKSQHTFLGPRELLTLLNTSPPVLLSSTLLNTMTLGIMDTPRGNEPILILPVRAFSEAFAGMLAWENALPKALEELLSPNISLALEDTAFQDMVIANHDSRVLKNKKGETIFIYTIFNRKFLIIVQSPEALETVIRQFSFFPPQ